MTVVMFAPVQPREFVTTAQLYNFLFSDSLLRSATARGEALTMPWNWNCYGLRREKEFCVFQKTQPGVTFRDFCVRRCTEYERFLSVFGISFTSPEISDIHPDVERIIQDVTVRYQRLGIVTHEKFAAAWCSSCELGIEVYGIVRYCPRCKRLLSRKVEPGLFLTVDKRLILARNDATKWQPANVAKRVADLARTLPSRSRITADRRYGIQERNTGLILDPKYNLSLWPMIYEQLGIGRPTRLIQGIRDIRRFAYAIFAHAYRDDPQAFPALQGYAHGSLAGDTPEGGLDPKAPAHLLLRRWPPEVIRLAFWYTAFARDRCLTCQELAQSSRIVESFNTARRFFQRKAVRGTGNGETLLREIGADLEAARQLLEMENWPSLWRRLRDLFARTAIARGIPAAKRAPLNPEAIDAVTTLLDVAHALYT